MRCSAVRLSALRCGAKSFVCDELKTHIHFQIHERVNLNSTTRK